MKYLITARRNTVELRDYIVEAPSEAEAARMVESGEAQTEDYWTAVGSGPASAARIWSLEDWWATEEGR